jgi:hypothetical protein
MLRTVAVFRITDKFSRRMVLDLTPQSNPYRAINRSLTQNPPAPAFHAPNLLAGSGTNYAPPPPNWDLNAIYNQAGGAAAGQINPYYTQQLQQFQQGQVQAKALQEQQRQLNLQNIGNQLTNTMQSNETSRGRTSQDVLQNEQQIGQQADYRQQDQGQQFDEARIAQAKQIAQGGLTGSGLGNQQTLQSQTTRKHPGTPSR